MLKYIKYGFSFLLGGILLYIIFNFQVLTYGLQQAQGQLKVIFNTTPVNELLTDKSFPDSLKRQIELIQTIKKFTVDSLGLNPSSSYNAYFDQHGEPILWMVTASPKYQLEAYEWHFPLLGNFTYKGFFKRELAEKEKSQLLQQDLDVRIGEVSAWSTLGYLNDPILSSMLDKRPGELAALIIHELTHGTLYVRNDITFNESLADFIGDEGALWFLESHYGKHSKEYMDYLNQKDFSERYVKHMLHGTEILDSLYQTFSPNMVSKEKDSLKNQYISNIIFDLDTLKNVSYIDKSRLKEINNAYFTVFLTYQEKQGDFKSELKTKFNNNFKAYLTYLKQNTKNLGR